jgi:hypothetical protein
VDLLSDPAGRLLATYGWAESLRTSVIDDALDALGGLSTLPVQVSDVDPVIAERYWGPGVDPPREVRQYGVTIIGAGAVGATGPVELEDDVALVVVPVPDGPSADPWPTGLYLGPVARAGASVPVPFGGGWSAVVHAGADLTGTQGLVLKPTPSGGVTVEHEQSAPALDVDVTFTAATPVWTLGDPASTRIDVHGLAVGLGIRDGDDGAEPFVSLAAADGIVLTLAPPDLGGFLRFLLGAGLDVDIDVDLELSPSGLRVSGALGLEFTIALNKTIGPLYLDRLDVALEIGTDGADLAARLLASLGLGPFTMQVDGLGAALQLALAPGGDGVLGGLDLALALVPPTRIVVGIESDLVTGGGFIEIDPASGRYAGGLAADFLGVGIGATVVVDTIIPGQPDAWSLFASIGATFPVPIPLGFGFTLNGVGGVLALDRTMDTEALSLGLRTGAVDAIFFPDDPLGDTLELLDSLDAYFPPQNGNTVVGPVVLIGWGAPVSLITGQLGVVLSIPDLKIAVMGSIEALLPVPEAPLLTLHMDTLGTVDIAAGTLSVLASLYDSNLVDTIDLGGDMALYLSTFTNPYFLMSVGGYHPGFDPPSTVPASMHDLRRMSASIVIDPDVHVAIEAYFAVTSNSVQFGAGVELEASVEIWPTTYTARGGFDFDVLLIFSPFRIVADMSAGVSISAGDKELFGVDLAAHLEGPKPWFASGYASFRFFGLNVEFELEVGGKTGGEAPPIAHPRADVVAALSQPEAWDEASPIDPFVAAITYTTPAGEEGERWIRPDRQLRAHQSVVPLDRTLEIVGQAVPAGGEERLTITWSGLDDVEAPAETTSDWFAPAQFEVLSRSEKLTRASFELMDSGVTFGVADVAVTGRPASLTTSVEAVYEDELYVEGDTMANSLRTGSAGMAAARLAGPVTPAFAISPTAWTLVRLIDGTEASGVLRNAGLPAGGTSQRDLFSLARTHGSLVMAPASAAIPVFDIDIHVDPDLDVFDLPPLAGAIGGRP